MDVPYQDQLVLNQDAGDGEVEQLLPPPEEPKTAQTGAPASADGGTAEDGSRSSSQRATAGTNGADGETGGADGERGADGENSGAQESTAATDGDSGSGEQVARTEPSRTPEGAAEPEAQTRTAAPSESDDQGQSAPENAPSGESSANGGAGDADAGTTGERGGDDGAETGDTAARTAPTEDTTPAAGSGTFLVQLAAFQNRGNAEKAWQRIQDKHRNVLGNQKLQLQRKRIPDKGIFWRVRTGPFPNRATADDLCGQLKRRGQPCLVMER
jgi:cell division septation protein DedD